MFLLDKNLINQKFPLNTFRNGQKEAIEFILDTFNSGKKYAILEAPTGAGKSAIGLTLANYFNKSFYITVTKILQSQIMDDFGYDMSIIDLKGRSTYPCTFYERNESILEQLLTKEELQGIKKQTPDCNEGYCRKKGNYKHDLCFSAASGGQLSQLPPIHKYSTCPYYERVGETLNAKIALMNFSNFLFQTTITDRFQSRDLLIIDEGHQLESQLLDFVGININDKILRFKGITLPEFDIPELYWEFFIENKILNIINDLYYQAVAAEDVKKQDEYSNLSKKIRNFLDDIQDNKEWVCQFKQEKNYNKVELKPVYVNDKAHQYIFNKCQHVLIMSATILDPNIYMQSLGIPYNKTNSYRMMNRFPTANRPIYYQPAAKMTGGKQKQHEWGPKLVKKVDEIIDNYPQEKGIIHSHNFSITNEILNKSRHIKRLLFQGDFRNKEEMINKHKNSKNTIIIAPAMHEGVDLKEDLSRLQIICKIPYPNFFEDKQLARRMELDKRYLNWITALKLVQSYGRSIRSEKDWAHTYIIDECLENFIQQCKHMLPKWFIEAIQ